MNCSPKSCLCVFCVNRPVSEFEYQRPLVTSTGSDFRTSATSHGFPGSNNVN